ncbi:MAG: GIY-YIG nuclease family protein [Salibacteraceae bacterium]
MVKPAGGGQVGRHIGVMFFLYVLKSKNKKFRYVGISSNVERRFAEHNSGKSNSTRGFKPFDLIHVEKFQSRIEARTREKFLKSGQGRKWLDLNI